MAYDEGSMGEQEIDRRLPLMGRPKIETAAARGPGGAAPAPAAGGTTTERNLQAAMHMVEWLETTIKDLTAIADRLLGPMPEGPTNAVSGSPAPAPATGQTGELAAALQRASDLANQVNAQINRIETV